MAAKRGLLQEDTSCVNANLYGSGLNATTLNAALAALGTTTKRTLFLTTGVWNLAVNVTVPLNITLWIPSGTTVTINGGVTFTVHGPLIVDADNNTWHSGGGTFVWDYASPSSYAVDDIAVNVKLFGAKVDGVTNDTAALNTALATYPHIFIPPGVLLHAGTIVLNIGNRLSGVWSDPDAAVRTDAGVATVIRGSALHYTGTGIAVDLTTAALKDAQVKIDHLLIYSGGGTVGIHVKNFTDVWLDFVNVHGLTFPVTTTGFSVAAVHLEQSLTGTDFVGIVRITNCMLRYTAGYGLKVDGGNNLNAIEILGNRIQGNTLGGIYAGGHALGWDIGGNDIEGNGRHQIYSFYAAGWNIHGNYSEPPLGNAAALYRFERGAGIAIVGNNLLGNSVGSGTSSLVYCGTTSGGYITQGLTIANNHIGKASAAWNLEFVRGVAIHENVVFFDVTREIAAGAGTIEGLSYKQMTRDVVVGQPASVVENTPTIIGMDTTSVGFAGTAAEQTLYSKTVLGKRLQGSTNMAGGMRFQLNGQFLNISAPTDLTIRVKYGGVTLIVLRWQAVAVNGSPRALVLQGELFGSMGFPGNQSGWMRGDLGDGDSVKVGVNDGTSTVRLGATYAGTAGADMGVDQTFVITAQMSVNNANVAISKESAYCISLPF